MEPGKALLLLVLVFLLAGCIGEEPAVEDEDPDPASEEVNETEENNYTQEEKIEDHEKEDFLRVLEKNEDVEEFLQEEEYQLDVEEMTPDDIEEGGMEGQDAYLYEDLPLETHYKVDIYNEEGGGFQTVLNMEEEDIVKIFRLIKMEM